MDTKDQLTILSEIGQKDLKIIESKEKLARLNKDSSETSKIAESLKTQKDALEQKKSSLLERRRGVDQKLVEEKSNVRKWEARAEKIKGERDYTALMSEIGSQKRTITGLEAELSEVTEELKKADVDFEKVSKEYNEKISKVSGLDELVKESVDKAKEEIEELLKARELLLLKIPIVLRKRYEKISEKKGNQGVAFLSSQICKACQRTVPAELYLKVMKGEVIEQCPSCLRILVTEFFGSKEA